ncbi:hypothetical protein C8F01DRAFT_1366670 [Mycena amicta]|nr:hypothetical protein C8F01DRAFT_1366670 [Mycena amicta]
MSLPEFTEVSTAEEVADALVSQVKGKNVIVTGTSLNGIGFDTARAIAKYANLVVITGYNVERLKLTEDAIKKDFPSANIRRLVLNLSSFDAVRKASEEVNAYAEPIHVLVNNAAGALTMRFIPSAEGYESTVATSYLGPALLTALLLPKLIASATTEFTPRIVNVSSAIQAFGPPISFAYVVLANKDADKADLRSAYMLAKCAGIVLARELAKHSGGKINAYSLHPGAIHTNYNQAKEAVPILKAAGILKSDGSPNTDAFPWKTLAQGAATTVAAAFDPRLNDVTGAYLHDCKEANALLSAFCADPANGQLLWTVTQQIIGEKFVF